jgi:hypothetical protein
VNWVWSFPTSGRPASGTTGSWKWNRGCRPATGRGQGEDEPARPLTWSPSTPSDTSRDYRTASERHEHVAAQADAFYAEAPARQAVWAVRDAGGFPAPFNGDGPRGMPFWSKRSRVEKIIDAVPAYAEFEPRHIALSEWRQRWLSGLRSNASTTRTQRACRPAAGCNRPGPTRTNHPLKQCMEAGQH